jgi:hypothetical protein
MVPVATLKKVARLLARLEELSCVGCEGAMHKDSCPAREAGQTRHVLTQRINNPDRYKSE